MMSDNKNPLISVNIPVYNGEKTLKDCLNSVINQTYKNYDVIVIDNNSIDKTKEIIEDFQKENKKIKYLFESQKGRGAARNAGINHSQGEIIAMTDSDCIVPPDWLENLTKPIREKEEEITMGFEKPAILNYWTKNIQAGNLKVIQESLEGVYIKHLDTKNFAIDATLIKKLRFNPQLKNLEDLELYSRIKDEGNILFKQNVIVEHKHKESGKGWFFLQIERGYWFYIITNIIKQKKNRPEFHYFQSQNIIKDLLKFIKILYRDPSKIPFVIISKIGWECGILKAKITSKKYC